MDCPFLFYFETPELILILLGGITNAHPLVRQNFTAESVVFNPQTSVKDIPFVQRPGDFQLFGQFSGAGASTQARMRTAWGSSISPVTMLSIQCIP